MLISLLTICGIFIKKNSRYNLIVFQCKKSVKIQLKHYNSSIYWIPWVSPRLCCIEQNPVPSFPKAEPVTGNENGFTEALRYFPSPDPTNASEPR